MFSFAERGDFPVFPYLWRVVGYFAILLFSLGVLPCSASKCGGYVGRFSEA